MMFTHCLAVVKLTIPGFIWLDKDFRELRSENASLERRTTLHFPPGRRALAEFQVCLQRSTKGLIISEQ